MSRNGVWRFDPQAGSLEILFRRIGENEMTAIGMCRTPITAEAHPGLDSEADRLVNLLLPHAPQESKPIPIHGYYFHILANSGGFAAIAYPASYRSSRRPESLMGRRHREAAPACTSERQERINCGKRTQVKHRSSI